MTVIALASLSGAPGVTTTAAAWAVHSAHPTLIIEAATAGGSPMLAGLWAGTRAHDTSVLALAAHLGEPLEQYLWSQAVALPGQSDRWVLPAIAWPAQARSVEPVWRPLAAALRAISDDGGIDVLIDMGRITAATARDRVWTLADTADVLIVVVDGAIAALNTAIIVTPELRDLLATTGTKERLAILPRLTGLTRDREGLRPYGHAEIASHFGGTKVLDPLIHDPRRAAVYAGGAMKRVGHDRSTYVHSIERLSRQAREHANACRSLIETREEI
ncbi:MAG: hypothetical protein L0H96_09560 [Humibacillus sp.]|nr:hypothetical protein [Humibacillus sp.]MDN5777145.1 hypothetical protein [Humibacillus sp.]MDN5803877.1 hypothetical protein [Microlunatus sp.]